MSDRRLIYLATFLRALATGLMGVLLGLYLARLAFSPGEIGLTLSAGLVGATLAVLAVTGWADRLGRRRFLFALTLCSAAGGVGAIVFDTWGAMLGVALLGMVNGQGRDRGAALVLEQAMLPSTTDAAGRTRAFAGYNLLQDLGHGLGAALAALPEWLSGLGLDRMTGLQCALGLYSLLHLAQAGLVLRLSRQVEAAAPAAWPRLTPQSRGRLARLSGLFAIDAVAGGFLGSALLAFYFHSHFGAADSVIAALFVAARLLNALSHLAAAWLARRIGLVNTMVFTHIPSSLLLMCVPIAPDFATAAAFFLLREGLVEMDVPTRQSYVMAVVRPEERTLASGVTHLTRLAGWAAGPALAGWFMQFVALGSPLVIGAAMKIVYDGLLWSLFHRLRPPEEVTAPSQR